VVVPSRRCCERFWLDDIHRALTTVLDPAQHELRGEMLVATMTDAADMAILEDKL
jgi:hypothetical protein